MDFQIAIQETGEIGRKMTVTVAPQEWSQAYEAGVLRACQSAHLRGFRPGKAPRAIVERQYGESVRGDLVDRLTHQSLKRAREEHKLRIVEVLQIVLEKFELPEPVEIGVSFEVYPAPTISNYFGRTVTVPTLKLQDDHVETIVQEVLKSRAKVTPITDRTDARRGDVVALKVQVKSGDEDFSRAEPVSEALGDGKMPALVEDGIVGMTIGETREILVPFDKKEGKDADGASDSVYRVELVEISERELPELNDEFVKGLNAGVETVDAFRAQVREKGEAEIKNTVDENVRKEILQLLVSENKFEVPQVMVDREIRSLCRQYGVIGSDGDDEEKMDLSPYRPFLQPIALERVRASIISDRIAEQEGVSVEEADVQAWADRLAKQSGGNPARLASLWGVESARPFVKEEVQRTKVIELLVSKTLVEYSEPEQPAQGAAV